jgi:LemA protein
LSLTIMSLPRIPRSRFLSALKLQVMLVVVALLAFGVPGCQSYDELVKKDQNAEAKWADIDAQLQRRADLIPNLVATVKGAAKHEESTLTQVMEARAAATQIKLTSDDLSNPEKMAAFNKAQADLKGSLSRLLVAQEAYPEVKALAGFRDLQVQIEGTENRILRAREQYNAAVRDYNTELGQVRGTAVNKITGKPFQKRLYFQADAGSKVAPAVSF